jgi:hypothetical protein
VLLHGLHSSLTCQRRAYIRASCTRFPGYVDLSLLGGIQAFISLACVLWNHTHQLRFMGPRLTMSLAATWPMRACGRLGRATARSALSHSSNAFVRPGHAFSLVRSSATCIGHRLYLNIAGNGALPGCRSAHSMPASCGADIIGGARCGPSMMRITNIARSTTSLTWLALRFH